MAAMRFMVLLPGRPDRRAARDRAARARLRDARDEWRAGRLPGPRPGAPRRGLPTLSATTHAWRVRAGCRFPLARATRAPLRAARPFDPLRSVPAHSARPARAASAALHRAAPERPRTRPARASRALGKILKFQAFREPYRETPATSMK